jgi:GMP synthase (glutamine-hydrolysing)
LWQKRSIAQTFDDPVTLKTASTSPTVLIVLHQAHSTPGRVGRLLVERGITLDIRRPPLGDVLPDDMRPYSGAVVFGGPMSANDDFDWLKSETDWIGQVLKADKPFLGLCLGAQMLAKHAGARVYTHEKGMAEIGYYPLRPTKDGLAFSQQTGLDWPCHVYHWHRDGFDVPSSATPLAQGDIFPEQAFVMKGTKAYGLQFHPEVTYAMMCRWTTRAHERMAMPGARTRPEHLSGWYRYDRAVHQWIDGFLDHWLAPNHAPSPLQG